MSKEFFHPSVTADAVILQYLGYFPAIPNRILLIRRSAESKAFPNALALPGGFMDADDEDIAACCRREVKEETGLEADYMKQIGTWTKKGRDPRGPVHTTAFLFVPKDPFCAIPGDDASSLQWMDIRVSSDTDNDGQLYVELTGEGGNGKVTIICSRETDKYGIESVSVRHVASSEGLNGMAFDHAEIIATAIILGGVMVKGV